MSKNKPIFGDINRYSQLSREQTVKKVRLKTLLFVDIVIFIIFLIIFGTLSISLNIRINNIINEKLDTLLSNDKTKTEKKSYAGIFSEIYELFPQENGKIGRYDIERYFTVDIESDGTTTAYFSTVTFTEEEVESIYSQINQKKTIGTINDYKYKIIRENGLTRIAVLDASREYYILHGNVPIIWGVAFAGYIIIVVLVFYLSKFLVKPVSQMVDSQNKFVSDASHELKTPLSIISASSDVLKDEIGDNKWLDSITSQVDRLSDLVNEMLQISKIEERDIKTIKLDISYIALNAVLPFEAPAYESGKKFEYVIQKDLSVMSNDSAISHTITILVDNAIKYSEEKGEIKIRLGKDEKGLVYFETYNTGSDVEEEDKYEIFRRFYRADSSRERNEHGGNGLGLSIVSTYAHHYKWDIEVDCQKDKFMKIRVIFGEDKT